LKLIEYQDEKVCYFAPLLDPSAKQHFHRLVVPKKHIRDVGHLTCEDLPLLQHMHHVALEMVRTKSQTPNTFPIIGFHRPFAISVPHLHMHIWQAPFATETKQRAILESNGFIAFDQVYHEISMFGQVQAVQPDAVFRCLQGDDVRD